MAHEWLPTYPKLVPSFVENVSKVEMLLINRREDVQYYEFGVFDKDFYPLPFVTNERVIFLPYKERADVEIFVRDIDRDRVTYICSTSKITERESTTPVISSMICSKIKNENTMVYNSVGG